jgi:prevent-host-death family protein
MAMESVSVAALKNNLSGYLAAVKKGKELIITSHRHPVARLLPVAKTTDDLKIIPAKKPVSSLRKIKGINLKFDLVADLLADRRRR